VLVYPEVLPVREDALLPRERSFEIESRLSVIRRGRDEFHGLREFRPGDNPKLIHWKTSAKTGTLLVREFEERRTNRACVVLETFHYGEGSERAEAELERGVVLTASIINHYYRKGYETGLFAYMPRAAFFTPERGRHHFFRKLEALAKLKPSKKGTLLDLAEEMPAAVLKDSLVFVVRIRDGKRSREGYQVLRRRSESVLDVPSFGGNFERILEG
jgi:uncharacterized protein (DUF58 family)